MPRLVIPRKLMNPPLVKGFKPYGVKVDNASSEPVSLLYEEYEAIKLCDYDMLNHQEASDLMKISRPTFTRIYASARRKIAKSLTEGRQIIIEGGKVYFDNDWYVCLDCGSYFNNPEKEIEIIECPLCGSNRIESYTEGELKGEGNG
jgi:uncharacterized protein